MNKHFEFENELASMWSLIMADKVKSKLKKYIYLWSDVKYMYIKNHMTQTLQELDKHKMKNKLVNSEKLDKEFRMLKYSKFLQYFVP